MRRCAGEEAILATDEEVGQFRKDAGMVASSPTKSATKSGRCTSGVSFLSQVLRREWPLIGIAVGALALRGYQLLDQVPIDDEWHALMQAMTHPIGHILTRFGMSDVSIPIAAYYKMLIATIGLNTWGLRLPFLLFGMATVAGFPLMVRPLVGRPAANALAALLSVSPILIFFSRYARPYAIALFCALGAAIAFRAWWESGRRRWAVAYVVLGVMACWHLMIVAPFVLGSFLLFGAAAIGASGKRIADLKRLVRLGLVTAVALAVLIGPALYVDVGTLLHHAAGPAIRPEHLYRAAVHALGFGEPMLALGIGAFAALGIAVLFRREPQFAAHFAGLAVLQIVGFVVARPLLGDMALVGSRYLLPVMAVILMFASSGIVAAGDSFGRVAACWLRPALVIVVCGSMLWWGPIALIAARPNSWASQYLGLDHNWNSRFYVRNVLRVPEFYRTLALQPPGSIPIVEASSNAFTYYSPLAFYQGTHRQPVLIGMHNGLCGPPTWGEVPYGYSGVSLRTHVFLSDIETMRSRGARYVIFHRDLYRETRNPPTWLNVSVDLRPCITWFRTHFGAPVSEDEDIVVFQLAQD